MEDKNGFGVGDEYSRAEFGDARLTARLVRLGDALARRPEDSFPDATGSVAGLEAAYRFLGNPKVTPDRILAPHFAATALRASGCERVVVAHDSSEFLFGGEGRRDEIGWLNQGNQGFLGHFALGIDRSKLVRPLGVLGIQAVFRHGLPKAQRKCADSKPAKESDRWWGLVEEVEAKLLPQVCPIHVMDREADDYELFSKLCANQFRFVIRIRQNRVSCQKLGEKAKKKLFELPLSGPLTVERQIHLSHRKFNRMNHDRKGFQARKARSANIQINATTISLPRPKRLSASSVAPNLILNCIHVTEMNAPESEESIDWKLVTSEPIETEQDLLNIVDDYRARWTIEEFFKALKTGCSYQKRQLESKDSLLNALAVFAPIAWQLLLLRCLGRQDPEASAEQVLSRTQLECLSAVSKKPLPPHPTVAQALLAVAAMGGHIPNNGDPGWIVLGRGMERLLTMEIAWTAASERYDQS